MPLAAPCAVPRLDPLQPPSMEFLLVQLLNSLSYGLLLFMLSSGLTLIFSMMGVLNFAHASFYMLGAYFAYTLTGIVGFWPALLLAPLGAGVVGALFERFSLRRVHAFGHVPERLHRMLEAAALVVATGGLSIPKMGATRFGYTVANQFGLGIVPCRPALVPLTFARDDAARYSTLAGVSAEAIVSAGRRAFRGLRPLAKGALSAPARLSQRTAVSGGM